MIIIQQMWAAPKIGHEDDYYLAWKHRHIYMKIYRATPFWQFIKKRRRFIGWERAMNRTKKHGRHVLIKHS